MTISLRRLSPAALLLGALAAGCDSTDIASTSNDRVVPEAQISIQGGLKTEAGLDSISIRSPLVATIEASDNAGLQTVITRVLVENQQLSRDSARFAPGSTTLTRNVQVALAGVRPGQRITVQSVVTDAGGNTTTAIANGVAFDPAIPRTALLEPEPLVIVGGTYTVTVRATDTLGISKIGFEADGSGITGADSVMLPIPLPKEHTAVFTLQVPSSAAVGTNFTVQPFAENRDGLRGTGEISSVRVAALGQDTQSPLVYQTIPSRAETNDALQFVARDPDGLVRIVGFVAKDSAGREVFRSADTLLSPAQQVNRQKSFNLPIAMRGRGLFVTGYATDVSGKTGWAVPTGATIPVTDESLAVRDAVVYAYGLTAALPTSSLGADIAVDTTRNRVYVSNINRNQVEVWTYGQIGAPLSASAPVAVGAQPWGMTIDNSGSILLVANSGGTNISKVNLLTRKEEGRIKTSNEYLFDINYVKDETSGGYKYRVFGPYDYSDRPQYLAQSANGALYYSTRPTSSARPGTLRRLDGIPVDDASRNEPRQIWQYASVQRGKIVVINADDVGLLEGAQGQADRLIVCDHRPGTEPTAATIVCSPPMELIQDAIAFLRNAVQSNAQGIYDINIESLALPDTNFVASGGDRRRIAFGEANTGGRAGRVMLVFDTAGTPAYREDYSPGIEILDLTNNASDQVFGIAINANSTNIGVHGVETFFADSSLRLQGKYATFNTGAGIAFHPRNVGENPSDTTARVAFVASGDKSIQIVDSYSYRLRGRIPLRTNLYGPLRAVPPAPSELAADPTLVAKLFGLTPEGVVVIDVRRQDIDNVAPQASTRRRR